MKRTVGPIALALALGLLVAACGGGGDSSSGGGGGERLSKEAYLTEVKAVGDKMDETMNALGDAASDPKAGAKQFETLGAAMNAAAAALAELNPPEEIQGAHDKFAEGIAELGDDIANAGEGLKSDDIGAAMSFMADLASSDAMKKIQEAADELEKAGYNVG